eukprot:133841-Hanusia_phi.AAC.1
MIQSDRPDSAWQLVTVPPTVHRRLNLGRPTDSVAGPGGVRRRRLGPELPLSRDSEGPRGDESDSHDSEARLTEVP